jgi:hypothetical protein
MSKTHYRKVFKSDHLGCADLEDFKESGSNMVFTISHVLQERGAKVAGKKIDANIAYFVEKIKPLVLNATNSKIVSKLANSVFVENWKGVAIQLYIDPTVKMKGDTVGGVRINPNAPRPMQELTPAMQKPWANAISAFNRDGNLNKVMERMTISQENQSLLMKEASQ